MLDPKAANTLGKQKAQNVEASINYIGEQLSQDAQQLANQQGLDSRTSSSNPFRGPAGFWVQAVSELRIEQTRLSSRHRPASPTCRARSSGSGRAS